MSERQSMSTASLHALARTLRAKASVCDDVGDLLSKQRNLFWECNAATHFKSGVENSSKNLTELAQEFRQLADELDRRAGVLQTVEQRA
jgi:uncharacterized protein YukE